MFAPEDSIHYTHQKLIVHILIETSTLISQKLNIAQRVVLPQSTRSMFVATDLEKYISYEDAIKSNILVNESSNFTTDFKRSRTVTFKLEQIEGRNFRYKKFRFISKLVL